MGGSNGECVGVGLPSIEFFCDKRFVNALTSRRFNVLYSVVTLVSALLSRGQCIIHASRWCASGERGDE